MLRLLCSCSSHGQCPRTAIALPGVAPPPSCRVVAHLKPACARCVSEQWWPTFPGGSRIGAPRRTGSMTPAPTPMLHVPRRGLRSTAPLGVYTPNVVRKITNIDPNITRVISENAPTKARAPLKVDTYGLDTYGLDTYGLDIYGLDAYGLRPFKNCACVCVVCVCVCVCV